MSRMTRKFNRIFFKEKVMFGKNSNCGFYGTIIILLVLVGIGNITLADPSKAYEATAELKFFSESLGSDDINKIRDLIKAGADVNVANTNGVTLLWLASEKGHVEVIKVLLEAKADVNAAHTNGVTSLWMASQNGHTEVVNVLLKAKADVNAARNTNGVTPLLIASKNGHVEVVKVLLKSKANVNAAATDGITSLWIASQEGHIDIVNVLLKSKADVNATNKDGATPLSAQVNMKLRVWWPNSSIGYAFAPFEAVNSANGATLLPVWPIFRCPKQAFLP